MGGNMNNVFTLLVLLTILCSTILSYAGGMRYLTQEEFGKYDKLLKEKGHPELKTIVAVYSDMFDPPRIGLKCVNKNKQIYQVFIEGDKIKSIIKTSEQAQPCQSDVFGQSAQKPPPIRNYQEYRIMMKALNDVNREKGLPLVKPLSKREWHKLWPEGGPDAPRKENPKEK